MKNEEILKEMRNRYDQAFEGRNVPFDFDEQVARCRSIIQDYLPSRLKGFNAERASYHLKHLFEECYWVAKDTPYDSYYICEFAASTAMVLEGFRCLRTKSMQYIFNTSEKDMRRLEAYKKRIHDVRCIND